MRVPTAASGQKLKLHKTSNHSEPSLTFIGINFHLQKSLEIFDKKSANKIQSKKDKGGKTVLPHANWG